MTESNWRRRELAFLIVYAVAFYAFVVRRSLQLSHGALLSPLPHFSIYVELICKITLIHRLRYLHIFLLLIWLICNCRLLYQALWFTSWLDR